MDFFPEGRRGVDIAPAMTGGGFWLSAQQGRGVMFWLGVDSPYAPSSQDDTRREQKPCAIEKIGKF